MERDRIEKLYLLKDSFNATLAERVDRFVQFVDAEIPRVAVLCADNRIRGQVELLLPEYNMIDALAINAADEDVNLLDVLFSDALIVVTDALKIAPKGLYGVLKEIAPFSKEVYCILTGWNSLPKTAEMVASKLQRVPAEFPLSKIVAVKNAYDDELEGFASLDSILENYANAICKSYERLHSRQNEATYSFVLKQVTALQDDVLEKINKEISEVQSVESIILAKQKRYEILFSHVSVPIQRIAEKLTSSLIKINADVVLSHCPSLQEEFDEDPKNAEKTAKEELINLLLEQFDDLDTSELSDVHIKAQGTVDECIEEVHKVVGRLRSLRFLPEEQTESLESACLDSGSLSNTIAKYDSIFEKMTSKVKKTITEQVYATTLTKESNKLFTLLSHKMEKAKKIVGSIADEPDSDNNFEKADPIGSNSIADLIHQLNNVLQSAEGLLRSNSGDHEYQLNDSEQGESDYAVENEDEDEDTLEIAGGNEGTRKIIGEWSDKLSYAAFRASLDSLASYLSLSLAGLLLKSADEASNDITRESADMVRGYFTAVLVELQNSENSLVKKLQVYSQE